MRGVPLFAAVYHDYSLAYGGDSAPLSTSGERPDAYQHALNLVTGKLPAGAEWSRWQPPDRVHPDQMAVLRNALALLKTPAGEVLLTGRRLPADPLRAEPLLLRFFPSGAVPPEERQYPALLHSVWASRDGRIVRLVGNLGLKRQRVEVPIAAAGEPGQRLRLAIYQADDGTVTERPDSTFAPSSYPLVLPPLGAAIVESIPAGIEVPR